MEGAIGHTSCLLSICLSISCSSPYSFIKTAIFRPWSPVRMLCTSVVFPAPDDETMEMLPLHHTRIPHIVLKSESSAETHLRPGIL